MAWDFTRGGTKFSLQEAAELAEEEVELGAGELDSTDGDEGASTCEFFSLRRYGAGIADCGLLAVGARIAEFSTGGSGEVSVWSFFSVWRYGPAIADCGLLAVGAWISD